MFSFIIIRTNICKKKGLYVMKQFDLKCIIYQLAFNQFQLVSYHGSHSK